MDQIPKHALRKTCPACHLISAEPWRGPKAVGTLAVGTPSKPQAWGSSSVHRDGGGVSLCVLFSDAFTFGGLVDPERQLHPGLPKSQDSHQLPH